MVELLNDKLKVSFPEVHEHANCEVHFQRTLRVPDNDQDYPLPAGLGRFPLQIVDDYPVPAEWKTHGGVFLPLYQSEALWIKFDCWAELGSISGYPMAVKVAAGKINAITGQAWQNNLSFKPQDYVVIPKQPWLDGFCIERGVVRQFVASKLGDGFTAEEQISGEAIWGGIQLIFYPMKAAEYCKRYIGKKMPVYRSMMFSRNSSEENIEMGLAAGGRIKQEIEKDIFSPDVWDTSVSSRCFIHLLNSKAYQSLTGLSPPPTPITQHAYKMAEIPWFEYYSEGQALEGGAKLQNLKSRRTLMKK